MFLQVLTVELSFFFNSYHWIIVGRLEEEPSA